MINWHKQIEPHIRLSCSGIKRGWSFRRFFPIFFSFAELRQTLLRVALSTRYLPVNFWFFKIEFSWRWLTRSYNFIEKKNNRFLPLKFRKKEKWDKISFIYENSTQNEKINISLFESHSKERMEFSNLFNGTNKKNLHLIIVGHTFYRGYEFVFILSFNDISLMMPW